MPTDCPAKPLLYVRLSEAVSKSIQINAYLEAIDPSRLPSKPFITLIQPSQRSSCARILRYLRFALNLILALTSTVQQISVAAAAAAPSRSALAQLGPLHE